MTAAPASIPSPAAPKPAPIRRRPRPPALARALLLVWAGVFLAGIGVFVYFIITEAHPNGQPRLGLGGKITIAVLTLNWLLLVWRARVLTRFDTRVRNARGAVCLNCHALLTREGREGSCPSCAEPFNITHLRHVWKLHTPPSAHGAP